MVLQKVGSKVEEVMHHCYRPPIISAAALPHKLRTLTSHNRQEELMWQTYFSEHELVHNYLVSAPLAKCITYHEFNMRETLCYDINKK